MPSPNSDYQLVCPASDHSAIDIWQSSDGDDREKPNERYNKMSWSNQRLRRVSPVRLHLSILGVDGYRLEIECRLGLGDECLTRADAPKPEEGSRSGQTPGGFPSRLPSRASVPDEAP